MRGPMPTGKSPWPWCPPVRPTDWHLHPRQPMLDRLQNAPRPPARSPFSTTRRATASGTQQLQSPSKEEPSAARKVCIVEFRSGEAVNRHPELKCHLDDGWEVESAVPQLTEKQCVELLVVMSRCRAQRADSV